MPTYQWSNSAVAQLDCTPSTHNHWEAILHLKADIDTSTINALTQSFTHQHIRHFLHADTEGTTIILPDIANDKQLLTMLSQNGWTQGEPKQNIILGEVPPSKNTHSFIKEQPLILSSIFYEIADLSWIASGIQRGRHNRGGQFTKNDVSELMIGVVMGCSDLLLGLYGKDKTKPPMIAFADALDQHLKKDGIIMPTGDKATPQAIHHSGYFESANAFLQNHVVAIKSVVKTAAGAFMMHSALKKNNVNTGKLAAGAFLIAGYVPLLILDHPHPEPFELKQDEHPNASPGSLGWFTENPRGHITAPLLIGNNVAKLWGAYGESQRFNREVNTARGALADATPNTAHDAKQTLSLAEARQFDYGWNVLASCSNMIGNYFFGLSGKKKASYVQDDPERFHQEMIIVASNILSSVPEKMRTIAINDTARYIASIKGVDETPEQIAAMIVNESQHIQHTTGTTR